MGTAWLTDLVVHDGTQAHDTDVDIVLLADNARIPQGLPAVAWGQPVWSEEEAEGVRVPNPAFRSPNHSDGLWAKVGEGDTSNQPKKPAEGRKTSSVPRPGA